MARARTCRSMDCFGPLDDDGICESCGSSRSTELAKMWAMESVIVLLILALSGVDAVGFWTTIQLHYRTDVDGFYSIAIVTALSLAAVIVPSLMGHGYARTLYDSHGGKILTPLMLITWVAIAAGAFYARVTAAPQSATATTNALGTVQTTEKSSEVIIAVFFLLAYIVTGALATVHATHLTRRSLRAKRWRARLSRAAKEPTEPRVTASSPVRAARPSGKQHEQVHAVGR